MSEIKLKEIDVIRLNPKPGDTLLFKIMSDDLDESDFNSFSQALSKRFPDQKVMVTMFRPGSDMAVYQVSNATQALQDGTTEDDCSKPSSYCNDCACGKKERVLAKNSAPLAEEDSIPGLAEIDKAASKDFDEIIKELEQKGLENVDQRTDKN